MNNQPVQQEIKELEEQLRLRKAMFKAQSGSNGNKFFVPVSIILAGIIIGGAVLYTRSDFPKGGVNSGSIGSAVPQQQPGNAPQFGGSPTEPVNVSADDDAYLGKENAPVTVIEFSDFQCPFCRRFWRDTLPQIKKEYIDTGKVKFVYRDFPLDFHQGAKPAAEGAECARDQKKFWELHDKIFDEQDKQGEGTIQFTKTDVVTWASQIGLDMTKFNQCLDSGKYRQEVEKDLADSLAAGANGTPTTFVNGRVVVGAQPFSAFQAVIDEELKKSDKQ